MITSCSLLQGEMEAIEYGCDFYNKTKVALEKLQNNHRWWNRFSNIGISVKVYFQLRSTVTLISTSFWISFYSRWRIVNFFPSTLPSICKTLKYDEKKSSNFYHFINKHFRFRKEGNNNLSLKCQEELGWCGLKPTSTIELSSFCWWHHSVNTC